MVRHMKQLLTIICLVLLSSYSYSEDPPPDGPYETFHENGQLEERITFKDGKQSGVWEVYDKNGQLRGRGTYKEGKEDGI